MPRSQRGDEMDGERQWGNGWCEEWVEVADIRQVVVGGASQQSGLSSAEARGRRHEVPGTRYAVRRYEVQVVPVGRWRWARSSGGGIIEEGLSRRENGERRTENDQRTRCAAADKRWSTPKSGRTGRADGDGHQSTLFFCLSLGFAVVTQVQFASFLGAPAQVTSIFPGTPRFLCVPPVLAAISKLVGGCQKLPAQECRITS